MAGSPHRVVQFPTMDHGVVIFPTEYSIAPDEFARALEERGFESLWLPEHTHIPASRKSPWPGGGDLPREAGRDPAAVTVSIFGVPPDAGKLAGLRDAGVARVVFFVPSAIA